MSKLKRDRLERAYKNKRKNGKTGVRRIDPAGPPAPPKGGSGPERGVWQPAAFG